MAGLDAYGIQLERSDMESTATFTALANVRSVSGPEIERETYDVTAHDSANGWREFIGGLKDPGELTVEINYDPAEHDTLVSDFNDDVARDYRMIFPGSVGEWEFKAFLTGFAQESPVDDRLSAELTFKVTSEPTISGSSS